MRTAITWIWIIGPRSASTTSHFRQKRKTFNKIQEYVWQGKGGGRGKEAMIKSLKFSQIINAIKLYYKIPQINVFLILALNEAGVLSRTICIMMTKIKVLERQNWLIWNLNSNSWAASD